MNNLSFIINDEKNNNIKCQILHNFRKNNNDYIIYTDGSIDLDNKLEILASKYILNDKNKMTLIPITNEAEWDIIDEEWSKIDYEN